MLKLFCSVLFFAALATSWSVVAQQLPVPATALATTPYGVSVTLEQARRIVAAGEAKARKNGWVEAMVVVDNGGHLVLFERMEGLQYGSIDPAIAKARSAVNFKRSTKALQDLIADGGASLQLLAVPGLLAAEGGLPIVVDGYIVGGFGVSGGPTAQDGQVATAGLESLAN